MHSKELGQGEHLERQGKPGWVTFNNHHYTAQQLIKPAAHKADPTAKAKRARTVYLVARESADPAPAKEA